MHNIEVLLTIIICEMNIKLFYWPKIEINQYLNINTSNTHINKLI